jgi:hypothetical protein
MNEAVENLVATTINHTERLVALGDVASTDAGRGALEIMNDLGGKWPECAPWIRRRFETLIRSQDELHAPMDRDNGKSSRQPASGLTTH